MNNFYIHPILGSSGNSGKGFYKFTFNSGGTATPVIGNTLTGETSGATCIILNITVSSGTWDGGDAAGTIYCTTPVGDFNGTENILLSAVDVMTMTSIISVDSFHKLDDATSAKGVTAADVLIIAKSPAPVSSGTTVTFTYKSRNGVLGAAQNATISTCETTTGWTASNSAVIATNTTRKKGSYSIRIQFPASVVADTLYATFDIGSVQDFSIYQFLEFWARISSSLSTDNVLVFKLLDVNDNVLHTFTPTSLQRLAGANKFRILSFDNGAALSNIVRKFAVYSGSSPGTLLNSKYLYLDDIIVSKAVGLHLNHLISISSSDIIGQNSWYAIKSINGTEIIIDNHTESYAANGQG